MKIELDTPVESFFRLSSFQKKTLNKMGLKTIGSILRHFPSRYGETGLVKSIEFLNVGENAIIFGKISKLKLGKTFRGHVPISTATLEDNTGKIKLIWFSQPYIAKMFSEGTLVRVEGKINLRKDEFYISNPKIEKALQIPEGTSGSLFGQDTQNLSPVYPESKGISSNWIYHAIQKIFSIQNDNGKNFIDCIIDPIPEQILKKYHLPSLKTALIWIHAPHKKEDAEIARKRFAFEEIFLIQLDRQKERFLAMKEKSFVIKKTDGEIKKFIDSFGFPLTEAQKKSINTILEDLKSGHPMSRLLEGDVGSGKTAVASTISYATVTTTPPKREYGNLQVAYMAPTEILAEQHFLSFIDFFSNKNLPKNANVQIGLITGSGAKKFPSKSNKEKFTKISKAQLLKWVANGEIPILIGTHSLIQKNVEFKNLALIIIDEQHRFGVKQRMQLRKKKNRKEETSIAPHLLSMTATPIPRTLALTIFGDLDLSILDELPKGRQFPETKIVLPHEREKIYEKVKEELKNGRQAFVICPRVNDPDPDKETAINAKSVKSEAERLQKNIFKEFKVGSITGQMKPAEKEKIMNDFKDKKIDILVATSVIEVGVNIPNATVMIIENAERFGLAQLHQLRGRILRSSNKPYCFVFSENNSQKTIDRLKSFINAKNGFELAEADLNQRGTGDLIGIKQWGVSDLAMEALKNIKMVEFARFEAQKIIEADFELKNYPILAHHLSQKTAVHME